MKKLLIPLILLLSSFSLSAQIADTTLFNHAKPMLGYTWYNMEFWTDSAIFHGSIHSTENIKTDGNLTVNDTLFWKTIYPTPFDSTHCWSEMNINTINGCPADQSGNSLLTLNTTRVKANSDLYVTDSLYVGNDIKVTGMVACSDTLFAPFIRLKNIHTTGTILAKVTSTGLLDTVATLSLYNYYKSNILQLGNKKKTIIDSTDIITDTVKIHSVLLNRGLYNQDTVITLSDDATFYFPPISVGWADIQCDSSLIEKTWALVSWNGDGATSIRDSGPKFLNLNTDGNYACFYDGGSYAILRNTSGYTQKYSIKYYYHY